MLALGLALGLALVLALGRGWGARAVFVAARGDQAPRPLDSSDPLGESHAVAGSPGGSSPGFGAPGAHLRWRPLPWLDGASAKPPIAGSEGPRARLPDSHSDALAHGEDGAQRSDESLRLAAGAAPLSVDAPSWPDEGALIAVAGRDALAPRQLTLWRVNRASGEEAALAHAWSGPEGRYAFSRVALPGVGAALVVAPRGAAPHSVGASETVVLSPRPLEAPRARLRPEAFEVGEGAAWRLEVAGVEPGAALVIGDRDGRELERHAWPRRVSASSPHVQLETSHPPEGGFWLAQELPDGRHSPWRGAVRGGTDETPNEIRDEATTGPDPREDRR